MEKFIDNYKRLLNRWIIPDYPFLLSYTITPILTNKYFKVIYDIKSENYDFLIMSEIREKTIMSCRSLNSNIDMVVIVLWNKI